jgi:hypothetical protein
VANAQVNLSQGIIASYPFGGNANNANGTNFDGTLSNVVATTDRFGNADKAYDFNGSNAFINLNSTIFNGRTAYTIAGWISPDAFSGKTMPPNFY